MTQSEWPKDWPEDKRTGPGFLEELMRRFPDRVQTGTLREGQDWLDESEEHSDDTA